MEINHDIQGVTEFRPAKAKPVCALLCVFAAAVLGFALMLAYSWRKAEVLALDEYLYETPAGFRYGVSASREDDTYVLRGWALIQGEHMEWVDCRAVLHHPEENLFLGIPTQAGIVGEQATQEMNDGMVYGRAGIMALIDAGALKRAPEEYVLCFAYRTNGHNYLINTGQTPLIALE